MLRLLARVSVDRSRAEGIGVRRELMLYDIFYSYELLCKHCVDSGNEKGLNNYPRTLALSRQLYALTFILSYSLWKVSI
jgi:hypothetical protein